MALQVFTAAYALHLERERFRLLWARAWQQVVYRSLRYLVVVQSTVTVLVGIRLPWHRMNRAGATTEVSDKD